MQHGHLPQCYNLDIDQILTQLELNLLTSIYITSAVHIAIKGERRDMESLGGSDNSSPIIETRLMKLTR